MPGCWPNHVVFHPDLGGHIDTVQAGWWQDLRGVRQEGPSLLPLMSRGNVVQKNAHSFTHRSGGKLPYCRLPHPVCAWTEVEPFCSPFSSAVQKCISCEVNVRMCKNVYKKHEHLFQELIDTILRYLLPLAWSDTQLNFERPSVPVD